MLMTTKRFQRGVLVSLLLVASFQPSESRALTFSQVQDLSTLTDSIVSPIIHTAAVATGHRAYMPATPLGLTLGVDIGLDVSYISLPSDVLSAINTISGGSNVQGIPVPKLNIHKGLPWGLDLGFSYFNWGSAGNTLISSVGLEAKWAFLSGVALPSVAARFAASFNQLLFISSNLYDLDVSVSKELLIFDPYIGGGMQFWNGEIQVPDAILSTLPAGLSLSKSGVGAKFFTGLAMNFFFLRLVGEYSYNSAGFSTVGAKLSLYF